MHLSMFLDSQLHMPQQEDMYQPEPCSSPYQHGVCLYVFDNELVADQQEVLSQAQDVPLPYSKELEKRSSMYRGR